MSYYGYPNPEAYSANYQAYAAYAANAASYNQYAAYNEAAYRAMQQQQLQNAQVPGSTAIQQGVAQSGQQTKIGTASTTTTTTNPSGIAISQPAQRYDYQNMQLSAAAHQQYNNKMSAAYYPYGPPVPMPSATTQQQQHKNKIMGMPQQQQQQSKSSNKPGLGFVKKKRPTSQVQIFYCDVCKISCAGPQTYKEHLDGQKHKKRELSHKHNQPSSSPSTNQSDTNSTSITSNNNNMGPIQPTSSQNQQQTSNINRYRNDRFSRNQLIIKCELCDIGCTGKDAYAAHLRGMKHQKTLKLHQKLGKPIPPDYFSLNNNVQQTSSTVNNNVTSLLSSAMVPPPPPPPPPSTEDDLSQQQEQTSNSFEMDTTSDNVNNSSTNIPDYYQNEDDYSSNLEPIGKEYIETRIDGKILSFYCKLCECQFNDPNAKDMHTKGRRHRLAYKKKVDPNLIVDMKSSIKNKSQTNNKLMRNNNIKSPNMMRNNRVNMINNNINNSTNNNLNTIKPLMSSNLTDNNFNNNSTSPPPQTSACTQPPLQTQTLQQLMSQPIKPTVLANCQYNLNTGSQKPRSNDSFDDRHIISKHNLIYPTEDEIDAIQEIVTNTEKALKLVSDQIAEEDAALSKSTENEVKTEQNNDEVSLENQGNPSQENEFSSNKDEKSSQSDSYRTLKGVMRVGLLAKGLLLKGDTDVRLIVICSNKPTKTLLERVYKILLEKIEIAAPEIKYSIILDRDAETILIVKLNITSTTQPLITCKVLLTSPAVRTDEQSQSEPNDNVNDLLDKQRCLDSLADLRHAKWFQAIASSVPNCVIIIRILRDLCQRNPTWTPLSQWALELLVERSLSSSTQQLSIGEALRRVLECVSAGVLLPNGCGLYDPCEKDPTDVADCLNDQQKEEITSSAQMALRLLAFKQIYKILGMECINNYSSQFNKLPRKRQLNSSENESQVEEKKERIEQDFNNQRGVQENQENVDNENIEKNVNEIKNETVVENIELTNLSAEFKTENIEPV